MSNPNTVSRFDDIYNSTNKAVLAFITAKCRNTADISDIFQDTYVELYQVLIKRGAEYITSEKAFVLKIAKQKISRYYSFLERLKIFTSTNTINENKKTEESELETESDEFELNNFLTEDFAINHILLETVKQFINFKPEDVQKIFYLMYDVDFFIKKNNIM